MKVKCVDNTDLSDVLTIGKVYDATPHDHHNDLVCVTDDSGKQAGYYATRFVPTLEFTVLEVGDYAYIRDDLERYKEYGHLCFNRFMKSGFTKVIKMGLSEGSIMGHDVNGRPIFYSKEMIDLSKSMKRADYLKMQEKEYTLNDVIDVASQAVKDGVLMGFGKRGDVLYGFIDSKKEAITLCVGADYDMGVDFIQSLYQEEFVIECEDDIKRIKLKAEVVLSNGNKLFVDNASNTFITTSDSFDKLSILSLKGATVKQSRK